MSVPPQSSAQPEDFKVFNPPSGSSTTRLNDLPDEYFTPTTADLKAAQATLTARKEALVNAPLKIKAVRDAEAAAKRDRWPEIRLKFMDQTQLEKVFPSTSKIRAIYAFVRSCLREDVKPIKFILYQPPKRDLKVSDLSVRDQTLSQLQLAPSSVLLLRFEDEALNHPSVSAPLADFVLKQAVDLPKPPVIEDNTNDESPPKPPSSSTQPSSSSKSGDVKMPKWLKLGNKK
ncbi:hypothetical protein CPC08DRAFT_190185 [Agrocybe pediades]|nr:hypothetical protein CPC08DRAFT_190185 [Agrocybe pediades]